MDTTTDPRPGAVTQLTALAQDPDFQDALLSGALRQEITARHGRTAMRYSAAGLPRTVHFGDSVLTYDARFLITLRGDGAAELRPVTLQRTAEMPDRVEYGPPVRHADLAAALDTLREAAAPAPVLGLQRGLHAALVERLGAAIVSGAIAPGHAIAPNDLAERERLSRTVVREAIRSLEARGLLCALPNRGTRVTDPQAWHWLDPDVVRWAEGTGRAGQLAAFRAGLDALSGQLAGNEFYRYAVRTAAATPSPGR